MNPLLRHLVSGIAVLASGAALANVTFYESTNFDGPRYAVGQPMPSFQGSGFNNRAQSLIVSGGNWEFCAERDYRGDCMVLAPGRYPNLVAWSRMITSARPTAAIPTGPITLGAPVVVPYPQGTGIVLFGGENFAGRRMTADRSMPNLADAGFNDRPRSAIVEQGSWQICANSNFDGDCTVLTPGLYPTLGAWSSRVSSARPAGEIRGERPRDRPRASAVLYSGPNFSGQATIIGSNSPANLDAPFNNRASSLRIERGYWIFCSEDNLRGECQTFGPGEYGRLPPELDNRISSGRRISDNYQSRSQSSLR